MKQRKSSFCVLGFLDPNSGCYSFFFLIWLCQSLDIMVSYHHEHYKKSNYSVFRKFDDVWIDGQTDRQTERQTDEGDFIEHCPTNAGRAI